MFIKNINKAIFLVLVLLTGCSDVDNSMDENKSSALQVYPKNISAGESFRLTFPLLHPKKLSIRSPSGTWYSIHNSEEGELLIPSKKYLRATELRLNSLLLKGVTWVNGKKVKDKVFQKNGEYLIYMANNLETEAENTFHFMTTIKLVK